MKRLILICLIVFIIVIGINAQSDIMSSQRPEDVMADVVRIEEVSPEGTQVFPLLVFQGADLRAVLQFFAETGEVNFIIDPPVSGTVDFRLKNITWNNALRSIVNTFDLVITREGNTFRIQKVSDYRQAILDLRSYEYRQRELVPVETRMWTLSYADAATMVGVLEKILSERGDIVVDTRTNSIIVNDVGETFASVDSLIRSLDTETPQIRVSVKIVTIDDDFVDELGIGWGLNASGVAPGNQNVSTNVNGQQVGNPMGQFTWGIVSGDYNINAQVAALISNNRGKILDNPEIVTLDNQLAEIQSGVKIPITTKDEAGNAITEFYDIGVELKVTPHITSENRVAMNIEIVRDSYTPTASGYSITSRSAKTNIIIEEKGALVIGGLTSTEYKTNMSGVPVLKDIPVIGRLFSFERQQEVNSELVLFVTPYIIYDNDSVLLE